MGVVLRVGAGKGRWRPERALRKILILLGVKRGSWLVHVAGDPEMAELHERTLGIAGTTDVLTFDMRDGLAGTREGAAVDLETVVCIDEAKRRAGELGHSVDKELLLYCVHSLLHVQGYDDRTAAAAERMHMREDELLAGIGVGAVYQNAKRKTQNSKRKTGKARRETGSRKPETGNSKRRTQKAGGGG